MFGRKNKRKPIPCILLCDGKGAVISSCPTNEFMLPEDVVISLSIEYFNDPEPCHIHRGAVHRRAMMELMEHCPMGETVPVSSLPESQHRYFSAGIAAIRFENIER